MDTPSNGRFEEVSSLHVGAPRGGGGGGGAASPRMYTGPSNERFEEAPSSRVGRLWQGDVVALTPQTDTPSNGRFEEVSSSHVGGAARGGRGTGDATSPRVYTGPSNERFEEVLPSRIGEASRGGGGGAAAPRMETLSNGHFKEIPLSRVGAASRGDRVSADVPWVYTGPSGERFEEVSPLHVGGASRGDGGSAAAPRIYTRPSSGHFEEVSSSHVGGVSRGTVGAAASRMDIGSSSGQFDEVSLLQGGGGAASPCMDTGPSSGRFEDVSGALRGGGSGGGAPLINTGPLAPLHKSHSNWTDMHLSSLQSQSQSQSHPIALPSSLDVDPRYAGMQVGHRGEGGLHQPHEDGASLGNSHTQLPPPPSLRRASRDSLPRGGSEVNGGHFHVPDVPVADLSLSEGQDSRMPMRWRQVSLGDDSSVQQHMLPAASIQRGGGTSAPKAQQRQRFPDPDQVAGRMIRPSFGPMDENDVPLTKSLRGHQQPLWGGIVSVQGTAAAALPPPVLSRHDDSGLERNRDALPEPTSSTIWQQHDGRREDGSPGGGVVRPSSPTTYSPTRQ